MWPGAFDQARATNYEAITHSSRGRVRLRPHRAWCFDAHRGCIHAREGACGGHREPRYLRWKVIGGQQLCARPMQAIQVKVTRVASYKPVVWYEPRKPTFVAPLFLFFFIPSRTTPFLPREAIHASSPSSPRVSICIQPGALKGARLIVWLARQRVPWLQFTWKIQSSASHRRWCNF